MNLIEELSWRGMIRDIVPGTEEQLGKEPTVGYIGFDPTADSLHIGSLVPILLLKHLQLAGHKPIALIGGATGMVGDPSGKSEERSLLDEDTLSRNQTGIKKQLEKYLDFDPTIVNPAELTNNYDWFRQMGFLEFIRDVGKHMSVNYMAAKDSVKKRLEGEAGMSFTEFTYQLVQGYDFYWLFKNKNCKLQMGGSDQWGNITTGTELIRRMAGGEVYAFTCPLITKADGGKFGKTEKGNVWLDKSRTSPYQFYQFWLNASDADAAQWIKIFTFLDKEQIDRLTKAHLQNPGARELQKTLAREVTAFVHGEQELQQALATTEKLFAGQAAAVESLSEQDLHDLEGAIQREYPMDKIIAGIDVVSFLSEAGILPSKGEARKMIQAGGISINKKRIENVQYILDSEALLHNKYLLVQKGKKSYFLVRVSAKG
ncbi:MAG TPA: tyrosine--tRNA ligase [Puia sp.]|nr:tyrosine--tRNA ligase [Puia sp.]